MAIIASAKSNSQFQIVPEGVHLAVCYAVIDLGLQANPQYGNKAHKVQVRWELPDVTMEYEGEEKLMVVVKTYTVSLHEKSILRNNLEGWRGKKFTEKELEGFDLKNILGKGCQIQILHSEDGQFANIANIIPLPKGTPTPDLINDIIYFDLSADLTIQEINDQIETLSEKTQEKIMKSETYLALI
jgi:hypothetical protein